jgi:hypothetical protein
MARLAVAKVTRKEIRLKYELMADKELNEVLPRRLAEFDTLVQQGTLPDVYMQLGDGEDVAPSS